MVNFGQRLYKSQYRPWSDHYMNYDLLKQILEYNSNNSNNSGSVDVNDGVDNDDSIMSSSTMSTSVGIRSTTTPITISSTFVAQLYMETEKVSFFVLSEIGKITSELSECRQNQQLKVGTSTSAITDDDNNEIALDIDGLLLQTLESKYCEIGHHLLRLIQFINLNVTGFRKVLKKHDKICRKKLSVSYLGLRYGRGSSGGRPSLMNNNVISSNKRFRGARYIDEEGMNVVEMGNQLIQPLLQDDTITAITVAYEAGIEDLRKLHTEHYDGSTPSSGYYDNDPNFVPLERRSNTLPNLQIDFPEEGGQETTGNNNFNTWMEPIRGNGHDANDNDRNKQKMIFQTFNSHDNLVNIFEERKVQQHQQQYGYSSNNLGGGRSGKTSPTQVLLLQIHAARGRLHQTNEFVKMLAAPMAIPEEEEYDYDDDHDEDDNEISVMKGQSSDSPSGDRFSNTLNLLSTFFYMTNYYIVAPTSATYAAKVGSDSSVASIIIGMTAFAALGSTILYSYWTSYSYKSALVFASTCSAIGNLLYASGLPYQSLTLVMTGRLMNGFGSARSINRRYIADSYSFQQRTAASAAFVTASALGMATGPFLASILHYATSESDSVYWQAENAPGWFMFVVWVIFLICLILKFQDPPRHHLLPKQEEEQDNGTSASRVHNNSKDETILVNETKPLLTGMVDTPTTEASMKEEVHEKPVPLYCNIPVIITLIVYMVLKMILEAVLSSESNLTALYFGWSGDIMGVHLTILALLILPINFGVAYLARWYFDRELIIGLLVAMVGGCIIIYQYQDDIEDYKLSQYLIGSGILFVCASALEAPNMSLLSKVIPKKWSRGIINVGLLATESGTLGRVIGDALLATMARHGLETMLNEAFGTFGFIVLAVVLACFMFYRRLEPKEE